MIPFPDKKYNVIYADPPWRYRVGDNPHGGVDYQYQTMTDEQIKQLPVSQLAADDCALFMWATFPKLKEALEVIDAWQFKYLTLGFSWIKQNRKGHGYFFGIGYYAKSNCEVCLLGIKGNPKKLIKSNAVSNCVVSPLKKHSQKPSEVRTRIDKMFGQVPKIELFARTADAKGWDYWGDEIENTRKEITLANFLQDK